ncbi:hypothetical protein H6P81_020599 [Aristolochia fimbriata]|uniref:Condensin-2 complex subunit G2 n=1 Tax=Aristolochia fimbriata TaxID=158543 RepID=A0AAV7DV61_ARIFI|nr:hypothetical protein H6P81_020599 [Aristolochia fimbriata]
MEAKRIRSSLKSSAEEFLVSAVEIDLKRAKATLKNIIWGIPSSSNLVPSLPVSLHRAISQSVDSFKKSLDPAVSQSPSHSPSPPPTKRLRRSSRTKKDNNGLEGQDLNASDNGNGQKCLKNLRIYSHIVLFCISHPQKLFSPLDLLPSAQSLHDGLILFESDPALMTDIASLCEEWWKERLIGRETLISQSLPYLVSKSLESGKKVDLHKVYSLREALCLFDFNDDSIEDLKHLLIRCVVTSLYLKVEDGRRFVAFLFGLNNQLMKETLAVIRAQIPFGKKSILEAFGDILFRAWKGSEDDTREELQNGFLPGLVEGAIYAKTEQLAASVRRILGGFISQRTTDGVDKLLFHLVEPVLFRSLQAANSNVRQNALYVLLDMFPVEDPDATKESKDTLLDKQFFLLYRLLVDDCPDIRVVAVEGSCRILRLYWEVIPPPTITKFLGKIIDDMTHDLSNDVRFSTLNGIIYLLENPQTHEVLRVLLPRLQHMFLNGSLSVQVAVVDLLLAIRDVRNFQFNKVVSLDSLLSSLANDAPNIARKITRLLITSYFPSKVSLKEACNRCIALIKRSPLAGARFCEFALLEGSTPHSLMELMRLCVELALSGSQLNSLQIEGLLLAAAHLSRSLASEALVNSTLSEFFSGKKLKSLLNAASTSRARTAVLRICSAVSSENIAGLLEHVIKLTVNCGDLYDDVERQEEVRVAHRLILSCGRFDDFFKDLAKHLHVSASSCRAKFSFEMPEQSVKRKKMNLPTKKSGRANNPSGNLKEDYVVAVGVAWQINDLLQFADSRNAVLNSPVVDMAFSALETISQVNIENCCSGSFRISPILAYMYLAMYTSPQHVEHTSTEDGGTRNNNDSLLEGSSQETRLNHTLDCLLGSIEKLLIPGSHNKSSSSRGYSNHGGEQTTGTRRSKRREAMVDVSNTTGRGAENNSFSAGKRILQISKIVTAVVKFFTDAMSAEYLYHNQERHLHFTSLYFQYIIASLIEHPESSLFSEVDMREMFVCLCSSITYAAKLLNMVLQNASGTSFPPPSTSELATNILDLIASTESYLDLKHISYFVAALKPWLPDLIIGLGRCNIFSQATQEESHRKSHVPVWLVSLGKSELCELKDLSQDIPMNKEKGQFPVLRNLMGMAAVLMRRGEPKILDAVGPVIMKSALAGLEEGNFALVLGLTHFVCIKLVGPDYGYWEELELMLDSLKEINIHVATRIADPRIDPDGKDKLERIKALLDTVGLRYH